MGYSMCTILVEITETSLLESVTSSSSSSAIITTKEKHSKFTPQPKNISYLLDLIL